MGAHINDHGQFQSDKYPTCPPELFADEVGEILVEEMVRCRATRGPGRHQAVHGFEAGQLWEQMKAGSRAPSAALSSTVHTENLQVIERMAIAQGWTFTAKPTEIEGWHQIEMQFDKEPKSNNPHGLKVVK